MDGRTVSGDSYRYGFQNQEEDSETGLVNYKYRMHDPRVGSFFAVDPLASEYPFYSPYSFSGNNLIDAIELEGLEPKKIIDKAKESEGTPYEFGGKKNAFKNKIPEDKIKDWYLKYVGYPSSPMVSKGGYGSRFKNPNYSNSINLNQYLVNNSTSCGIDCSGLTGLAFNADKLKVMDDFNTVMHNAKFMRSAFEKAEKENMGFLSKDLNEVKTGDLVFNKKATHVMIATGETRMVNKTLEILVTHAPETGREVVTEWVQVKKGWSFGRTF